MILNNALKMLDIIQKQKVSAVTIFNVTPRTSCQHWPSP